MQKTSVPLAILLTTFLVCLEAAAAPLVRVLVWDEQQPEQKQAYGDKFLGETIAAHLAAQPGFTVRNASLDSSAQGLDDAALNSTDVLIWWSHVKSPFVTDENVERIVTRVRQGTLGFIALHSAHWARPFVRLMQERAKHDALAQILDAERASAKFEYFNQNPLGKVPLRDAPLTPALRQEDGVWKLTLPGCIFPAYRGDGAPSHVTTLLPEHPIAAGLPLRWDVAQTEMYDEPFHVPKPDAVVFEERWDKGEHFRAGCVWQVGKGHVFYFRPGHETFPVFKQAEPLRVVENAARWLARDAVEKPADRAQASPAVQFDPVLRDFEGWKVHVDPALLDGPKREEGAKALMMLANHLQRIKILMPSGPLAKLQTIEIWIEHDHPKLKSMQYHPSRDWLADHGHDPRLARKVHITQARELLSREQMLKHPAVVLHELAHGYHDQILGFDHPEIIAAYRKARESGSYTNVLLYTGKRVKHYGLTDHKEYFAEGTEAYLYRNDFYPFVRAELKEHDPEMFQLLERLWNPTAPSFAWPERLDKARTEIKQKAQARSDAAENGATAAGKTNSPLLTVQRIFDSSDFGGDGFSARWLEDSSGYTTFEPSKETPGGRDLVRYDPKTGAKEVLVPAGDFVPPGESLPLGIDDHIWSKDKSRLLLFTHSKRVWRTHSRGDYWVLDRSSHEVFKLGGDAQPSTLMFAKFSPDGQRVAYVRERNIYVQDLRSRRITALTTQTSPEMINGTFDWVYEEEFSLRDGFRWSPDGRFIAYWQLDTEGVREVALVNNTDGLYPTTQVIKYPKTGEMNSSCRVGAVELATGQTRWMEVPGDPRNHYIFDLEWLEGSPGIFLQQLNRLQNTNRVMLADPVTGKVKTILTDGDAAWVEAHQSLKWIEGGKRFVFWSEHDGWQHLYLARREVGKLKLATKGDYDVTWLVHVDEKDEWLYFMASPENPTQRYLFRTRFGGRQRERVTPIGQSGTHSYQVSPDGSWAFHTLSTFDQPPVTELISLPDHKQVRVLNENTNLMEHLAGLKQPATEFFRVPLAEGVELDAWFIKPPDFDATKKYPLVIYVYGEPAGSTVKDSWGGKSHLWHLMLAQQGYLVMSIDNRGTDTPRGRAWRKSIYRQIGVLASQDQAAALKQVIATRPYVDAKRIGIWGWSGGGSMTLNMLLRHPDLYQTGISIASVPNMRYYDTIYQERYMGLPADNADGYRNGSPITFASQLKGNLLLIHGTGDDNCHYQGAETLVNEFIKHNKPFRMMSYPNRSHGISEGENTTLHLRELMTSFLHEKLPAGAR